MDSVAEIDNTIKRLLAERAALKARGKKIAARLKVLRVTRARMVDTFASLAEEQERIDADLLADFMASEMEE
jgi:hypothetical protein